MPSDKNNDKSALIKQVKQALALADSHLKHLQKELAQLNKLEADWRHKANLLIEGAQLGKIDKTDAVRMVNVLMQRIADAQKSQREISSKISHLRSKMMQLKQNFDLLTTGAYGNKKNSAQGQKHTQEQQQYQQHQTSEQEFWDLIKIGITDLKNLSTK